MSQDSSKIDLNDLARQAGEGCSQAEKVLMDHLTVSFRALAQHKICNDHDAEEVVQEALSVIWSRYREIAFEQSFLAWAYQILKHKILDYHKQRSNRSRLIAEAELPQPSEVESVEDLQLRNRLLTCLRRIAGAHNRYARILNLNYQGYSTEEICERLKMTRGNCYTLLMRARQAMMACLERQGGWK